MFKKIFNNQSGISLVEVMVAAGISSVIALATMQTASNSQKAMRKVEQKSELTNFMNFRLRGSLSSAGACTQTMSTALSGLGVGDVRPADPVNDPGIDLTLFELRPDDTYAPILNIPSESPFPTLETEFNIEKISVTRISETSCEVNLPLVRTGADGGNKLGASSLNKKIIFSCTFEDVTNDLMRCSADGADADGAWDLIEDTAGGEDFVEFTKGNYPAAVIGDLPDGLRPSAKLTLAKGTPATIWSNGAGNGISLNDLEAIRWSQDPVATDAEGVGIFAKGAGAGADGRLFVMRHSATNDRMMLELGPGNVHFPNSNEDASIPMKFRVDGSANIERNVGIGLPAADMGNEVLSDLAIGDKGASNRVVSIYDKISSGKQIGLYSHLDTSTGTVISSHYKAIVGQVGKPTNNQHGYNYGVQGLATYNNPNAIGRMYGVQGVAGNGYSGYNYGVYGKLSGSSGGAGVFGTVGGDIEVDKRYAGYFNGDVSVNNGDLVVKNQALKVGEGSNETLKVPVNGNFAYKTNVLFANTGGDVGIGTGTPTEKLHVKGNVLVDSPGGTLDVRNGSATIDQHVFIGGGVTAASNQLFVSGSGKFTGDVTANGFYYDSDRRLKERIYPLDPSLKNILDLNPVSYHWQNKEQRGNQQDMGLIAQEVEKTYPDIVKNDARGFKSVNYGGLISPLIKSVQELHAMIEELTKKHDKEISKLKAENKKLKNQNEEILKRLERLENKVLGQE